MHHHMNSMKCHCCVEVGFCRGHWVNCSHCDCDQIGIGDSVVDVNIAYGFVLLKEDKVLHLLLVVAVTDALNHKSLFFSSMNHGKL